MKLVRRVPLNRVERFKQRRILIKGYITAAALSLFFLITGILAVDRATNQLVSGRQGIALAAFDSKESSLEITLMNQKIYLNTQYINRDMEHLRDKLSHLFG